MAVVITLLLGGCVDKNYDVRIKEIDMSVSLAPGGLTIPLATIPRKTLGDYIDLKNKPDVDKYLDILASGGFVISASDNVRQTISEDKFRVPEIDIDPAPITPVSISASGGGTLPTTVGFSYEERNIETGAPDLRYEANSTTITPVNHTNAIGLPAGITPGSTIPAPGAYYGSVDYNALSLGLEGTLPKEIKKVNKVWFGDAADGALVTMTFNSGNNLDQVLQQVNFTSFELTMPERYAIVNPSVNHGTPSFIMSYTGSNAAATHKNKLSFTNHTVALANRVLDFVLTFYIQKADMTDITPIANANGEKEFSRIEPILYNVQYTMNVVAGAVGSDSDGMPGVSIQSTPTFRDAEFVTEQIQFELPDNPVTKLLDYQISGFPESVRKVNSVTFDDPSYLYISLSDLGLPFAESNKPWVEILFPPIFDFAPAQEIVSDDANGTLFRIKTSDLVPAGSHPKGYAAKLSGMTFGPGKGVPVNGVVDLKAEGYQVRVSMSHTFAEEALTWSAVGQPAATVDLGVKADPALNIANIQVDMDAVAKVVSGESDIDESFDMPDQVVSVEKALVSAQTGGGPVMLRLAMNVQNALLDRFLLDDVRIKIPDFVILAPNQPNIVNGSNLFAPSAALLVEKNGRNQFEYQIANLQVEGFKNITITPSVGGTPRQGSVNGKLEYSMNARMVEENGMTISDPNAVMTVTPTVDITPIAVNRVYGNVDLSLAENIAGDGGIKPLLLPAELIDHLGDSRLPGMASPIIKLEVENPTGINFAGKIKFVPKDSDGNGIPDGTVTVENFKLAGGEGTVAPAADPAGPKVTVSKLYITGDGDATAPEGWELRYVPGLANMVKRIPAEIGVEIDGNADQEKNNFIETGRGYTFDVKYSVELPLEFSDQMDLDICDTITNLNKTFRQLADYKIKARQIVIVAALNLSFPIRIGHEDVSQTIFAEFLDGNNLPVPGLSTKVEGVIIGHETGPEEGLMEPGRNYSELRISLDVPSGGDMAALSSVNKLKLTLPLSVLVGQMVRLNAADYVEGRVWLELPHGIEVDIRKLQKGNDGGGNGQEVQQR